MTAAINTLKPYTGSRAAIDLSAYILDPDALFATHKARVIADGGTIPDEPGCLARFQFLLENGMFTRATICAAPAFGIKTDGDGNVKVVYNLLDAAGDLLETSRGTPPAKMSYDSVSRSVNIRITSSGGTWLQSRSNIIIQKMDSYLIAGRMSDLDHLDGNGITMGYSMPSLPVAYMRTMITNLNTVTESWRFGTRDSGWPAGTGGAVTVFPTTYEDYVPAAGLFNVTAGSVRAYVRGSYVNQSLSVTGTLANLAERVLPMVIGTPGSTTAGCHGSFLDALFLHTASESDAILTSRLGM